MFDSGTVQALVAAADQMCAQPVELATVDQLSGAMVALRSVMDRLEGREAELLAAFETLEGPAEQGASSTAAWARQHLRLDGCSARARIKAGRTLATLPQLAAASRAGQVRLAHVTEFTAALTKADRDVVVDAQGWLVDVARTCDPAELRGVVHQLVDAVHPERLDQAWVDGMDKNDLHVSRVGDGYAVTGFLDIVTGSQVKTWLDTNSAPRDADDTRAPSQRRIDAVRALVSSALEHGLPTDRGIRPQLHVMADLDTLLGHSAAAPPVLAGYGPVGPELLDYLRCNADLTPLLAHGDTTGPTSQARILNVGRTQRLATPRKRIAVRARQEGLCAAPGCRNTHLELHHVAWWGRDHGPTDLDNLTGLCPRCHHLVHTGQLAVAADGHGGFLFTGQSRTHRRDHWRQHRARIRNHLRALRHAGVDPPAPPAVEPAREGRRPCDRGWPTASLPELAPSVTTARGTGFHRRQ